METHNGPSTGKVPTTQPDGHIMDLNDVVVSPPSYIKPTKDISVDNKKVKIIHEWSSLTSTSNVLL